MRLTLVQDLKAIGRRVPVLIVFNAQMDKIYKRILANTELKLSFYCTDYN